MRLPLNTCSNAPSAGRRLLHPQNIRVATHANRPARLVCKFDRKAQRQTQRRHGICLEIDTGSAHVARRSLHAIFKIERQARWNAFLAPQIRCARRTARGSRIPEIEVQLNCPFRPRTSWSAPVVVAQRQRLYGSVMSGAWTQPPYLRRSFMGGRGGLKVTQLKARTDEASPRACRCSTRGFSSTCGNADGRGNRREL